ncbi:peptidase inhibitor family I36 protein [Streptomyces sp. WAC 01529]|uniref:peptidase inhibitor family I36 protein n=1 Tax=Streptomyces sp. WAC 01529 TaxID=2203205 RepID=UPI0013DFE183|nr:peptidase inhibitor family I36 protein [Streptomyces sp. WAC 01529]
MRTTTPRTMPTAITSITAALLAALAVLAAVILSPPYAVAAAPPTSGRCAAGELCLWEKAKFKGARHAYELADIDIESCIALPEGGSAQALANRTGRPVTAYQSAKCAETAEFNTYPGSGTWAPESPYRVRAFKVWEN